jgi:hypothetical protein
MTVASIPSQAQRCIAQFVVSTCAIPTAPRHGDPRAATTYLFATTATRSTGLGRLNRPVPTRGTICGGRMSGSGSSTATQWYSIHCAALPDLLAAARGALQSLRAQYSISSHKHGSDTPIANSSQGEVVVAKRQRRKCPARGLVPKA